MSADQATDDDWKRMLGREPRTVRQIEIRDAFIRRRGYWADDWQLILELDPEFLAKYTDLSAYAAENAVPVDAGGLDRKSRELIYVALYSQLTHRRRGTGSPVNPLEAHV